MHSFKRGQTSVELIIVLAMSLVILSLLVSMTTDTLLNVRKSESVKTAQQSMSTLVEAINQTFASGTGTVRFVTITWPPGLDSNAASLSGNPIRVRLYDTDVIGVTIPVVEGIVGTNPGTQRVRMRANDTNVTLGSLFLSADQSSVYLPMSQDSNSTAYVRFYNLSGSSVDVVFSSNWDTNGLVDVNSSPTSATIAPEMDQVVTIQAAAGSSAIGNYTGSIQASATFGSTIETLVIPLNVEVFSTAGSLLSVYPSPITLWASAGDTNYTSIQVCNNGDSPLKTISFTPSGGNAGEWVSAMTTLSQILSSSCVDKNVFVTPPADTSIGTYAGSMLISDYTGANTQIVPLSVTVKGMANDFSWDWNTAVTSSTAISGFGLRNTGSATAIISNVTLSKWWSCDSNHSTLTAISVNGNTIFSGNSSDGNVIDVTDFNVGPGVSYANNSLTFSSPINDENEQFQALVDFNDGTEYISTVYGSGCTYDTTPPAPITSLIAFSGAEPESIVLQFTFSGDNNFTGTATSLDLRYSTSSDINTDAGWANGTPITYTGSFLAGGSTGSVTLSDLNGGDNYYFAGYFSDELDNNAGHSNAAVARPWNQYQYSLNDFNITTFAHSLSSSPPAGSPGDVNGFSFHSITTSGAASADKNIVFLVTDDANTNNSWIAAVDIRSGMFVRIRTWYPVAAQNGAPRNPSPVSTVTPNTQVTGGLNFLDTNIFNTVYRFDGSAVSIPRPNQFKVTYNLRVTDFNISFDLNDA